MRRNLTTTIGLAICCGVALLTGGCGESEGPTVEQQRAELRAFEPDTSTPELAAATLVDLLQLRATLAGTMDRETARAYDDKLTQLVSPAGIKQEIIAAYEATYPKVLNLKPPQSERELFERVTEGWPAVVRAFHAAQTGSTTPDPAVARRNAEHAFVTIPVEGRPQLALQIKLIKSATRWQAVRLELGPRPDMPDDAPRESTNSPAAP